MRINNNIMAYNAQRNLGASAMSMGKSIEKLSSGLRINRAADDASGLVISQKLRAQTSGLRQATRNAQDGISVVQTAEGGLNEVHTMLNRMRDLAVQSANTGANDSAARQAAQEEFLALRDEINRIGDSTSFGDTALLDGSYGVERASVGGYNTTSGLDLTTADSFDINIGAGAVTVNVGGTASDNFANGDDLAAAMQTALETALPSNDVSVTAETSGTGFNLNIEVGGLAHGATFTIADGAGGLASTLNLNATSTATQDSGATFQVGADAGGSNEITVDIDDVSSTQLGVDGLDLVNSASAAIGLIDTAITTVSTQRGDLGAVQNRLESTISNLQVTSENLAASESRIRDVDVAAEMVNFTRSQILQQAGTAMLGQANANSSSVLRLLG